MEYLLPKEYVQTFKIFHTDAPRTSLIKLKKVIEEELKRPGE
jgi:predicted unusual protein kinase regulating ubiquinone biosynthesis (AarF/ABC1/UbiB family)